MNIIHIGQLVKTFRDGEAETKVLKGVDFEARKGEWVAVMGRSGAGKSTLLYQMGLLDDPTSGEIVIDGHETHAFGQDAKTTFRLTQCGYVFQDYALLPDLTALENVVLPLLMQNVPKREAYRRAEEALTKVKLAHRLSNLPSHLSGGEQQRVAIARAIVHKPKILFADEPTANLDRESSETVLDIFEELHREGQTIIMVTHEDEYAKRAERIVTLDDGKVIESR